MSYDSQMTLELKPELLKDISIGDKVTVVVKGTVCELRDGRDPDKPEKKSKDGSIAYEPPASIRIEVESRKITEPTAFSRLADDEDED